jgi:hypothetical protein
MNVKSGSNKEYLGMSPSLFPDKECDMMVMFHAYWHHHREIPFQNPFPSLVTCRTKQHVGSATFVFLAVASAAVAADGAHAGHVGRGAAIDRAP